MTVPPLAGWEQILIVVVLAITLAAAFLVVGAVGRGAQGRSDWQEWLDGRSGTRGEPATAAGERPVDRPRGVPGAFSAE